MKRLKNKNKVLLKDKDGIRWWFNRKTGKKWPTHWKMQAYWEIKK